MSAAARTLYHWALRLGPRPAVTAWGTVGQESHWAVTLLGEVVELREGPRGAVLLRRGVGEPHWSDEQPPEILAQSCTSPRHVVAAVRRLVY